MVNEKGIAEDTVDKIGLYAKLNGGAELVEKLKNDELLKKSKGAVEALEDLETLFKYCSIFNINDKVTSFYLFYYFFYFVLMK